MTLHGHGAATNLVQDPMNANSVEDGTTMNLGGESRGQNLQSDAADGDSNDDYSTGEHGQHGQHGELLTVDESGGDPLGESSGGPALHRDFWFQDKNLDPAQMVAPPEEGETLVPLGGQTPLGAVDPNNMHTQHNTIFLILCLLLATLGCGSRTLFLGKPGVVREDEKCPKEGPVGSMNDSPMERKGAQNSNALNE